MQPALAPRIATTQDHVSDQILREQLLSQANTVTPPRDRDLSDGMQQSSPASPNDPSGGDMMAGVSNSADSGGEDGNGDGRKGYGKRELSTSKRAAQNRAAQRAFRQRKEGYIKKLEEQVRDTALLNENFKAVQAENYQLRDYIISLQSRLLESQGEVPPPPSNVDGLQPGKAGHTTLPRLSEMGPMSQSQDGLPSLQENRRLSTDAAYRPGESAAKRAKLGPSEMTSSQAALQGASILTHPPR